MLNRVTRKRVSILIILSILFCEMCFSEQPFKTYSFCGSGSEITTSVQVHINRERQTIGSDQGKNGSESGEVLRRSSRRMSDSFLRRTPVDLLSVKFLPQIFHSSIFLQYREMSHNTSGHIALIRCMYQKDGKKRVLLSC